MAKLKRPSVTKGTTTKAETGCGSLYTTIGKNEDDKPIEVFATLGKAGGCAKCQTEALGRVISLGLRHEIPIVEFAEQLKDLRCPSPHPFPKEEANWSCLDAVAIAINKFIESEKPK